MSEVQVFEAPTLQSPASEDDKFRRQQRAFFQLLGELLKTHRGQYVAIHDGRVVGSGSDPAQVALQAYRAHGYQPIYVDFVGDHPMRPIRIPHYRLASGNLA